jgi:hypothetical protein
VEDVAGLIPLSVLELDLPSPDDWPSYLAARQLRLVRDDVGRDSVSRSDVRVLLAEYRETVAADREAAARKREVLEREAEERDQLFRTRLWGGVPADHMPPDVLPAAAMLQSVRDTRPRRTSVLEEALANDSGITFHSLAPTGDES